MRKLLFLAVLGMLGFAAPSSAETVAEIADRWGILGNWQKNCDTPVSENNDRQSFVIRSGKLFLDRSRGEGDDSNPVTAASIDARGELDLLVTFPTYGQNRQNVHAMSTDGRQHIVLNRNVDTGEYTVRNGILLSTGNAVPWLTHCD